MDSLERYLPHFQRINGRMTRVDPVRVRASLYLRGQTMQQETDFAATFKAGVEHIRGQVDAFAEAQKKRMAELTAQNAGLSEKQVELQARLQEIEQRAARQPGGEPGGAFNFGGQLRAMLEGNVELQAVAAGKARRAVMDLPANFFKAAIGSTGITMPDQHQGIVAPVTRRLTIRSLIPSVPTIGGSISYLQETGFTNLAATVSESNEKPESNLTFQLKTAAVVTIAHWIRCTNQVLADIPQLQNYIDGRLRYGLAYVEDVQMLVGSGVGNNLNGLKTAATAYNRDTALDTRADEIRRAITQLELTDYVATGIILNPSDWEKIALAKETGTGGYVMGPAPGGMVPTTLWGLPVISTPAMAEGDWLVGDFPQAALIFDREQARVDISTETDDDFTTNRCHIRAEERLALAVLRPGALIKGDFDENPPTG